VIARLHTIQSPITTLSLSIASTQDLLNSHTVKLKSISDGSRENRTKHLASLESTQSSKINKHEIALSTWRTVSYLKGTTTVSTLTQIDIPSNCPPPPFQALTPTTTLSDPKIATKWATITDPSEIEYYLQMRNRLHFGQAHGTPFSQPELASAIPWGADSVISEQILLGT
jgi:hypothetical protein